MLNNLGVFITILICWIGIFAIVDKLFASRSLHPHRRRRDLHRTKESNVHAAPDVLMPVVLTVGGIFLFFTALPFMTRSSQAVPSANPSFVWPAGFALLVSLSYFYFLRNSKGPPR